MALALRFTSNIEGDLARGWSGWMSLRASSLEALVAVLPDICDADGDVLDTESAIEYITEHYDVRYDEVAQQYVVVHHDGLSCYAVADREEAIAKIASLTANLPGGEGAMTLGTVQVIEDLGGGWYLLECDDTAPEPM